MIIKMAFLKIFFLLFFVIVSSAIDYQNWEIISKDDHNIVNCPSDPQQDDWVILDRQTVSARPKFLQIVEKTVTYPTEGKGKETLTCIRVSDEMADGSGGYPEILSGGIGFRFVTVKFTSQRSRGFKFLVEIWGK